MYADGDGEVGDYDDDGNDDGDVVGLPPPTSPVLNAPGVTNMVQDNLNSDISSSASSP